MTHRVVSAPDLDHRRPLHRGGAGAGPCEHAAGFGGQGRATRAGGERRERNATQKDSVPSPMRSEPAGALGRSWIAGLIWGVLSLASDNYLYLSVLLVPLFWPSLRRFAAFLFGVVLVVSPIALRNFGLTGELIPISAHGGEAVYIANNPRTDGLHNPLYNGFQKLHRARAATPAGVEDGGTAPQLRRGQSLLDAEDRRLRRLAAAPLPAAAWGRRRLLWRLSHRAAQHRRLPLFPDPSPVLPYNPLHFGVLLPFGVVGLLGCLTERRRVGVLYVSPLDAVPVLAVFATSRYRMPLMPFLTAFAVLGRSAS